MVVKVLGGDDLSPDDALAYLNENIDLGNLPLSQFGRDDKGDTIKEYVAFDTSQIEAAE